MSESQERLDYLVHPKHGKMQGACTHCGHRLYDVLPIEPLFSLKFAASLIPCSVETLRHWLTKGKDNPLMQGIPIYRKDRYRRVHRYLRAWEVQVIRDHIFETRDAAGRLMDLCKLYEESGKDPDVRT